MNEWYLLLVNLLNFSMLTMCANDTKDLYKNLREIGCCKLCTLRFLGETAHEAYLDVDRTLTSRGFEEQESGCKIQKTNPCIACLGLLARPVIDDTIRKISEEMSKTYFDSRTFQVAMTIPISFQLRAHAMWIYITETFPHLVKGLFPLQLVSVGVKDVWKWILEKEIESTLSKTADKASDFSISIAFKYNPDEAESFSLCKMGYSPPAGMNRRNRRNRKSSKDKKVETYSRKSVELFLSRVDREKFSSCYNVPPKIPDECVHTDTISFLQNPIYIAGRYNKLTRNLSQTPWIIDGVRRLEDSVQELISNPLLEISKSNDANFIASGREDVDVRTLGRGRPFTVECFNPHRTIFDFKDMRFLENKINSDGRVVVKHLQIVSKDSVQFLKDGEEHKTKAYCAYCVVFGPLPPKLETLHSLAPITLLQTTPIRVLHRRPLAVREKVVHSIKAIPHISSTDPTKPSYFKLYVTTQAGTYIKEFVHGDFGRTKPSLCDLLDNAAVDIVALDVQDVYLEWPTPVKYVEEQKNVQN